MSLDWDCEPAIVAPRTSAPWSWRGVLLIAALTLAALAPFANKPFHIDDPLYLWSAQHIREHPLDFYGFDVHWYFTWTPIHEEINNPPLVPYCLALASLVVGWSEIGLHACTMLFAAAGAAGMYVLASRFCSRPMLAALLAVLTPGYLVCANTVMVDVPMLCLWIWAIVLWDKGLREDRAAAYAASAVLIAACALTKYFGASLIPLLLVYSLFTKRTVGWAFYLLIPIAILGVFEWWTYRLYGRGLIYTAIIYPIVYKSSTAGPSVAHKLLIGTAFSGGCAISALLVIHWCWSRWMIAGAAILAAIATLAWIPHRPLNVLPLIDVNAVDWLTLVQGCAFVGMGVLVLSAAAIDVWRRRDPASVLLALWVAGTFVFSAMLNWSVTARTILPLLPAAGMLLVRRMEDRHPNRPIAAWKLATALACSAGVSVSVIWGDYTLAQTAKVAALRLARDDRSPDGTLWFQGHWGFQYYLQQRGGKPLDVVAADVEVGDFITVPGTNTNLSGLSMEMLILREEFTLQPARWIATMNRVRGAGFHSSAVGELPFSFGAVAPERYRVYEIVIPADATVTAPPTP